MKPRATHAPRLLIVDDDEDMAEILRVSLEDHYACETASSANDALVAIERQPVDVVITDVQMSGMSGLELLDRLRMAHPDVPVIVVTGYSGIAAAVDATKRGAFDYLSKPYDVDVIRGLVATALQQRDEGRAAQRTPSPRPVEPASTPESEAILGTAPVMSNLFDCIESVAAATAPALILGETGSGKELVAHAIHARGPRRKRPFVAVNVSAIPEQLLESEIFGHVKGAFSGAVASRRGLLLEADGGTLFLDEIGDMPIGLQAKLLRVLQFGEVRAIGADTVRQVDVRILAATHRDLAALIESGQFRQDLYFRLAVLPIAVPPLRERRSDIAELATHFLERARDRNPASPVRAFGPAAMDILTQADWPGNVRQLAGVVERLVVFVRDEVVGPEHLGFLGEEIAPGAPNPGDAPWELETLKSMNERYVAWVLTQTAGSKARAAQILGINESTLYRWQRSRVTAPESEPSTAPLEATPPPPPGSAPRLPASQPRLPAVGRSVPVAPPSSKKIR